MSSIDDEIVRAKMRKLRVSTFADIFYEVVNDEAYADALPEDIFLAAVEEAYTQRQQRNIAKAITQAQFRYPDASLAEITRAEQRGINMRQLKRIAAAVTYISPEYGLTETNNDALNTVSPLA